MHIFGDENLEEMREFNYNFLNLCLELSGSNRHNSQTSNLFIKEKERTLQQFSQVIDNMYIIC